MAKVQITNKTLYVINLLVRGRKDNETKQLLPKQSIVIERNKLSGHEKKLEQMGRLSIKALEEVVNV